MTKKEEKLEMLRKVILYYVSTKPEVHQFTPEQLEIIWILGGNVLKMTRHNKYRSMEDYVRQACGNEIKNRQA